MVLLHSYNRHDSADSAMLNTTERDSVSMLERSDSTCNYVRNARLKTQTGDFYCIPEPIPDALATELRYRVPIACL